MYGGKKWTFEKGIEYKDVHPSFSVHLGTLKNDKGVPFFEIDHQVKTVKFNKEKGISAAQEDDSLRLSLSKKSSCTKFRKPVALKKTT